MATDNEHLEHSLKAGADLTDKLYYGVELSADNTVTVCNAQGEDGVGVLYSEAAASGRPVAVAIAGVVKAMAGATITYGQKLTVQADGQFEPVSTGDLEWGIALEGAASGDIFKMLLLPGKNITA